ncbi:MAG: HepT-like ribonuclease domain-containing protein [Anaerolineae bacterium]
MKVDLCLHPRAFTRDEVFARLPQMREVLREHKVQLAYLFGSVLLDASGPLSDVDIAVLPNEATYRWLHTYGDIYDGLCRVFGADNIDVVLLNEAQPPIRFAAVRDGILIWETRDTLGVDYAEEVLFEYHDTQPIRDEVWSSLIHRIREGLSITMRRIDPDKLRRLLGKMDESVVRLKNLPPGTEEEFLAEDNWQTRALVEHFLRIAIESAMDAGRHIIVRKGLGVPETYKDIARLLRDEGIVAQPLGDRLIALAGLRNVLVHLYWDIDYGRLYQIATTQVPDFDEYARALLEFVAEDLENTIT